MLMQETQEVLGKSFMWAKGGVFIPTFRFTVVTTAPNETFALPFEITGTYDCHVDWDDGNESDITVWNHADTIHNYVTPGTHEIAITGTITGWRFNNGGDCALYHETKSWGPVRWGNNNGYYYGCVNHTCTATDVHDMTGTINMGSAFKNNKPLVSLPSVNSWDWSNITSLNGTWQDCDVFNQDISGLDWSSVITARFTLATCPLFDQDLSALDITALTDATSFLQGSTLSVANYDALITSWSAQAQTIVANFHGGNSKYTGGGAVETARDAWVAKGWVLTDAGIA